MTVTSLMSYMTNIDWRAAFQWYLTHLDAGYLIWAWEQGRAFTHDDWLSFAVLWGHFLVLTALIYLLIKTHRETLFRAWVADKRTQITGRPLAAAQTKLEPKLTGSLKKAYNLHRLAMYEPALSKYREALHSSPYDLNTYLVGIKIISEMDVLDRSFVEFLTDGFEHLREKHPRIWNEVARYGQETAPNLAQWQPAV